PKAVIIAFDRIRTLCETQPIDVREWFKGTSFFGIARAKATLGDKEGAKDALSKALSRHFWNFPLIQSMDVFSTVCGKVWIDSVCSYWSAVREKEIPFWHPQPTLLLKPKLLQPNVKYPVLIVLQGGNDCYERLVSRLNVLPDSLNLIIAFPAAVHRISEVTNSWDGDTNAAEAKLNALIQELSKDPGIDTKNISLFGYSQGSQIAYDYGISHPDNIRNVVAFSGFAPTSIQEYELKNAAEKHLMIVAISGSSDSHEFLRTSLELQKEALQQGLSFDLRIEPDLPHGLPMDVTTYFSSVWKHLLVAHSQKDGNILLPHPDIYKDSLHTR
ncbi:MAG: alpha/beta hydrolase, partial [Candidatus Kapaibacterium sp.]